MSCQSHTWRQEASLLKSDKFMTVNWKEKKQRENLNMKHYVTKTFKEKQNKARNILTARVPNKKEFV